MTRLEAKPAGARLLERGDAQERVRGLVDDVRAGSGGVLAVEAEAGLGKSAILDEMADRASGAGCSVLRADGDQLELQLAFGLVRQLLGPAVRDPALHDGLLEGTAVLAAPALGLAAPSDKAAPADPLAQALHGLHWLCLNLADRSGPLLLIVDDAHWGDIASLRFLAYLARRIDGAPVGLAVAFRPATEEHTSLLGALGTALRLTPLTDAAASELIRRHRPDADDALCAEVSAASGGNPFLLTDLAIELRDHRGTVVSFVDRGHQPDGPMARSVARRVDRLGADARRLAEAISLFPNGAALRHVAELTGFEPGVAATLADSLAQSLVIGAGRPLTFRHPLLREAVLTGIPPARRAHEHGRIADLLAAENADADEVAAHVLLAEPAARADWSGALVTAADRAAAAGAPDAALALLARAAAEPPPADQRPAIRLRQGMAELALGEATSADTLLEVLEATEDPGDRVPLIFALAHAMAMTGRFAEVVPLLEAEAGRFDSLDADLALRLRGEAFWIAWQDVALREDAWRLLGELKVVGAGETLAQRIALAYRAHAALAELNPVAEVTRLAMGAAGDGVLPQQGLETGAPMSYAVNALAACDRLDDARAVLRVAEQAFRDRGELIGIPMAQAQLAWIELLAGDIRAAEVAARLAMAALETQPPQHLGAPWARAMLALSLLEGGEVAAAMQIAGDEDPGETTSFAVTLLAARGEVRAASGDLDGAIDDLQRAVAWCERKQLGEPVGEEICRRRELALLLARAGRRDEAVEIAGRALAEARQVGGARQIGESLRAHALVTGGESAVSDLREAADLLATTPGRLAEAKALVELGAMLRRANQRSDAREPLRRGMDMARRCGAAGLAERAETELRATGAKPRRLVLTGVESLTPSELRVARMAAGGATNREIAQELFVTLRTVEGHLSNAFRKLDVSARGELAAALETG